MRKFLVFSVLLFISGNAFSGDLTIEKNEGSQISKKSFSTTRIPLDPSVSLVDVSEFLNYKTFYNPATKILQVYFKNHQLKIQDNNPFIVLQSLLKNENMEVIQLPAGSIAAAGEITIPVNMLTKILKSVVDGEVQINTELSVISISKRIFDINRIIVEEKSNGTLIRFPLMKKLEDFENHQDENGNNYLTMVNVKGDVDELNKTELKGLIKGIIAKNLQSNALQLIIKVTPSEVAGVDFQYNDKLQELMMSIRRSAGAQSVQSQSVPVPQDQSVHLKTKWAFDVIVLDAGHGGKDPGTHGPKGTNEKDVSLSVVKKLGALINSAYPEIEVVYTRKDDRFIDLDERGKIANRAKGKLFISVHCNANPKKGVKGIETYFLGLHKSDEALEVSKRENSVILDEEDHATKYKDFTDENLILLTMAQSAYLDQSEKLALHVTKTVSDKTPIDNRGVKQAGFMVLWTPSMPSILVEIGYLSNKEEEKYLASKSGQTEIAQSIFEAVKKFKQEYEESLGIK